MTELQRLKLPNVFLNSFFIFLKNRYSPKMYSLAVICISKNLPSLQFKAHRGYACLLGGNDSMSPARFFFVWFFRNSRAGVSSFTIGIIGFRTVKFRTFLVRLLLLQETAFTTSREVIVSCPAQANLCTLLQYAKTHFGYAFSLYRLQLWYCLLKPLTKFSSQRIS